MLKVRVAKREPYQASIISTRGLPENQLEFNSQLEPVNNEDIGGADNYILITTNSAEYA